MSEKVDAVVIGMGPGGEDAAGKLAEAGLNVVGIEKELVGGECPYWGCIPSKMMIRAADLLAEARRIPGFAGSSTVTPDWGPVAKRVRQATDNWNDKVAVDRFEGKGGHFVRGIGRITGPSSVSVDGRSFEAGRAVVIATGSAPATPPIPGLAGVPYWTNRQAIEVEQLPRSLIVVGGGAIGLELAQVFARFGVAVTVVEALARLLAMEEPEASEVVSAVFQREGLTVHAGAAIESVERQGSQVVLTLKGGQRLAADQLLVATGRQSNLKAIGVDALGIDTSQRFVPVDDHLRVKEKVWAIGDVTGKGNFTHVATYQADIAVKDILGIPIEGANYQALPRVTFTDPEVGAIGLTEATARKQGIRVETGIQQNAAITRGWIHGPGNDGLIKLVADADRGVLVGATCVGPRGGDMQSMLELAVRESIPVDRLRHLIYAYPTFYRGIGETARMLPTGVAQRAAVS
ncbi:MAG TPA: NAD(P)/FAD-dependent oxidoreductase [Candidatus Limnocylindria bacterium]|nr:NAD(P)/FAD-dependent oxidoreductase [Candidatus Limnocylindria bacterium]